MLGWPLQKNKNLIHRKRSRWVFASLNGERYQRGFGSNSGEENGIRRRGFGHNRPLIQHVWPLLIGVSYETFRETVVRLRALLHDPWDFAGHVRASHSGIHRQIRGRDSDQGVDIRAGGGQQLGKRFLKTKKFGHSKPFPSFLSGFRES